LNGGVCHPIPINQKGLDVRDISEDLSPGFCYVTPSHQYPLGGTLSITRRIRLIEYARLKDCFILEDDYDSEFRYDVQPLQPLYELDKNRVIYCGTFSKTLCPALRTAYLILPPALLETARRLKWYADLHNATLDQLVLSRFIDSGDYIRHIGKMKKRYKSRRSILLNALSLHFADSIEILGAAAGLHLCVRFPGQIFDRQTILELKIKGLILYPVAIHSQFPDQYEDTLIFGYGILSSHKMEKGIMILKEYLLKFPGSSSHK
jgi:GntR family transcriptional regulator/MocR family aminotransferase